MVMSRRTALDVLDRIERSLTERRDLQPCIYGHLGCTYREHGPCGDEACGVADYYGELPEYRWPND